MMASLLRWFKLAVVFSLLLLASPAAIASVVVVINGNTADAMISLTDSNGRTFDAEVTIVFDTPRNLSVDSLNLTAQLVDPNDPQIQARLPSGVSVDPAFPMLVTVEPIDYHRAIPFSVRGPGSNADLRFLNTYEFEVHTADLIYTTDSPYRLFKAPIGASFEDITEDVLPGSTRARGRGGEFSQFLVVNDTRSLVVVVLQKAQALLAALTASGALVCPGLLPQLIQIAKQIVLDIVLLDFAGALGQVDALIAQIEANAGTCIPNVWRAERDVTNEAGLLLKLAETLRFTLNRILNP